MIPENVNPVNTAICISKQERARTSSYGPVTLGNSTLLDKVCALSIARILTVQHHSSVRTFLEQNNTLNPNTTLYAVFFGIKYVSRSSTPALPIASIFPCHPFVQMIGNVDSRLDQRLR